MTLLGKTVGHIRIESELGKGGMGEVYIGFDEKLERKVALKAILGEHRMKPESKARFLPEAKALEITLDKRFRNRSFCKRRRTADRTPTIWWIDVGLQYNFKLGFSRLAIHWTF